jgi:cyclic-di-GMP phosphodiesterase TipF (flagellum assembly factor)
VPNNTPLNIVGIVVYVSAAVAVAFLVPMAAPSFSPAVAQLWGAIILLTGVITHDLLRRHARERTFARAIVKQSRSIANAEREWTHARLELEALRESLDASSHRLTGDAATEMTQIKGEMQLLRKMMDKVMNAAETHAVPMRLTAEKDVRRERVLKHTVEEAIASGPENANPPPPPPDQAAHRGRPAHQAKPVLQAKPAHQAKPAQEPTPGDISILQTIREALKANRIELYIQQVVTLPERSRRYFECYSRLRTEWGELMFPQQYLPVAERTGLTGTIDNVLLLRCIQLIRKLQQRDVDVGFFCNISPMTLKDSVFLEEFSSLLANNQTLARSLVLEFRQADFALIQGATSDYLERLAAAGFRFSVDHVTTFDVDVDIRALAERHVRFLKIPGSMLVATAAGTSRVPLREIQERLKASGIELIAERIETKGVLRTLEANGVALGQGFLLGEPVKSESH